MSDLFTDGVERLKTVLGGLPSPAQQTLKPSFDMLDRAAGEVYRVAQKHLEDPDIHKLAASAGDFSDANAYTQKMFREMVLAAWRALV